MFRANRWLLKAVKECGNYPEFEQKVLSNLSWYQIPKTWTKEHIQWFWIQYH